MKFKVEERDKDKNNKMTSFRIYDQKLFEEYKVV